MNHYQIPKTHKALQFKDYLDQPESCAIVERYTQEPVNGQLLIKLSFATINPSDLMFVRGLYGIKKKPPFIGGFEGSGEVVKTSINSRFQIGDRVAVVAGLSDGTWSEFMICSEDSCLHLQSELSLEQGAMLFVNPLTCYAMFHKAIEQGASAIVQTAGASALGKMMVRLAKKKNIPLVNVVRKDSQVEILKKLGAEYVLNSEKSSFDKEFYKITKKLNANYLIDAVGGELTTRLFPLLPMKSTILIYGNLSEKDFSLSPGLLIFQDKKVEGFWLTQWIQTLSHEKLEALSREVQGLHAECFATGVSRKFSLSDGYKALDYYKANMTEGKVLFSFSEQA